VNRLNDEAQKLIDAQDPKATEEVHKQQIDAIKAAVAQANGAKERYLDVLARAYKFAPKDDKAKPFRDGLYKSLQEVYKVRFGNQDGLDAWLATAASKPLPNPSAPITPIFDPEPASPGSASGSTATPAPAGAKPAVAPATAKPDAKTPAKPVTKPVSSVKPQANVKKPVAKKKRV
jgi:hypothetical protein